MQKLIITATLLVITAAYSKAQFFNNVGIKSGVSIANQDWNYKSGLKGLKSEFRSGLYLGITSEMLKGKYFSLMADLGYTQKGAQYEVEFTTSSNPDLTGDFETLDSRYDFISFQPVAKFRLPTKILQPYLFAGPRLDFYLGYSNESEPGLELTEVAPVSFGASYGLGLDFAFSDFILALEAQHQPDFTYLYNTEPSSNNLGLSVQNQAFLVTLGVKYILN